jgi:hypothetical protein
MKQPIVNLLIGLSFLVTPILHAAEALNKDAVESLVTGRKIEGRNVVWEKGMKWNFLPSGELKKRDEYGNKGKGTWFVNDEGKLCHEFKHVKEHCLSVVPRDDGGYDLFSDKGELEWTFDRFLN